VSQAQVQAYQDVPGGPPAAATTPSPRRFFTATTDGLGRYAFAALPLGTYRVSVKADGFQRGAPATAMVRAGESATADIQLEPGIRFAGRVLGADGKPLPGAKVTTAVRGPMAPGMLPHFSEMATTDAQGAFVLETLGAGELNLRVRAEGHVEKLVPVKIPSADVQVALARAAALEGIVLDERGQPVSRAFVNLDEQRGPDDEVNPVFLAGTTRADGRFKIDGVGEGRYLLKVRVTVKDTLEARTKELPLEIQGTKAPEVRVLLDPGLPLAGVIRDEQGKPVAKVSVAVAAQGDKQGSMKTVRTDEQGAFRFQFMQPGQYRLTVFDGKYSLEKSPIAAAGDEKVTVTVKRRPLVLVW
jgi:uncharacterized GH25 family protein